MGNQRANNQPKTFSERAALFASAGSAALSSLALSPPTPRRLREKTLRDESQSTGGCLARPAGAYALTDVVVGAST
jgi:hypothetical protein